MNSLRICIFLFPWEIDLFQDTVDRLKIASTYCDVNSNYNIVLDVTMNMSEFAVDFSRSKINKDFFENSFNSICDKAAHFFTVEHTIDYTKTIFGCVDKRRQSIANTSDTEAVVWLDLDVFFPAHILNTIFNAIENITDDYFIITPETVKLWDSSWDIITNKQYLSDHPKKRKMPGNEIFNVDVFNFYSFVNGDISLKKIQNFKFAGGWFNTFSGNLLKLIGIPESFGPYGLEDTYLMTVAPKLKSKGYNINQYVLENLIVGEYNYGTAPCQHSINPSSLEHGINFNFKDMLEITLPTKEEMKHQAEKNFQNEIFNKLNTL